MPSTEISIDIKASSETIFDLTHDYPRRLEWDSFLREARLLHEAKQAGVGVSSRCVAKWSAGGAGMDTVYISFKRPEVAAVKMTSGPWFMRRFAASIRHHQLNEETVRVTYRYNFSASRFIAFIVEPVVNMILRRETAARLQAMKRFAEDGSHRS